MITACTRPAAPEPAVIRISPPPWDAPRDAVSYIEAAGLAAEPLNSAGDTHIVAMTVVVDGWKVPIPAYVGMDRRRAQRAVVHTHDTTNQVWLEGRDIDDDHPWPVLHRLGGPVRRSLSRCRVRRGDGDG